MAVAFDTSVETPTGTTFTASVATMDITITPSSSVKGLLVFVFDASSTTDIATSVKINPAGANIDVPAVSGGRAVDTVTEPGSCKAFFLGTGLPAGGSAWTVRLNRTNNTDNAYMVAVTVTASFDTTVVGVSLAQENGAVAEVATNDGSPGSNSVRFAGTFYGGVAMTAGANSTLLQSIIASSQSCGVVRETTAGQGSRNVGFNLATDDRAAVYLAVRELIPLTISPGLGSVTMAGQTNSLNVGSLILTGIGSLVLAGQIASSAFTGTDVGILNYTGQAPQVNIAGDVPIALPHGTLNYTGQLLSTGGSGTILIPAGTLTEHGLALASLDYVSTMPAGILTEHGLAPSLVIVGGGTTIAVPAGTLNLTGQYFAVAFITPPAGSLLLTGQALTLVMSGALLLPAGNITEHGLAPVLLIDRTLALPAGTLNYTGQQTTVQRTLDIPAGQILAHGFAPTIDGSIGLPAGTLNFTGQTSPVLLSVALPAGSLVLSGQVTIGAGQFIINMPAGILTHHGLVLVEQFNFTTALPAGILTLSGQNQVVSTQFIVALPAGQILEHGLALSEQYNIGPSLPAGQVTLSGQVPSVVFASQVVLTPQVGPVTLHGLAPVMQFNFVQALPAGTVAITGQTFALAGATALPDGTVTLHGLAPAFGQGVTINLPAPLGIVWNGKVEIPSVGIITSMPAGTLTVSGLLLNEHFAFTLQIPAGSELLSGQAPLLTGAGVIPVPAGKVTHSSGTLVSHVDAFVFPQAGVLTHSGRVSSLRYDFVVAIPQGLLNFAGQKISTSSLGAIARTNLKFDDVTHILVNHGSTYKVVLA